MVTLMLTYLRKRSLSRRVKAQSADYSEIKKVVRDWLAGDSEHETVGNILNERKRQSLSSDTKVFKKALLFLLKSKMVEHPFDLRGTGRWYEFITSNDLTETLFITDKDTLKEEITKEETFEIKPRFRWIVVLSGIFVISSSTFLISCFDWGTDTIQTYSTANHTYSTVNDSTSVLFYMQTAVPILALLFTTVMAILGKPWQLLYYQWKVQMQMYYDRFDKPKMWGKYAGKPLENYAVLNRFKFSLTQGGQESALQIVVQWSTYFAACYLVAISKTLNPEVENEFDSFNATSIMTNSTLLEHPQLNDTVLIFKHVQLNEINIIDEENHFNDALIMSGVASIMSIALTQVNMLRSEHQSKSMKFCCDSLPLVVPLIIPALLNTLSSSLLLIQTATRFLDVILLSSSSLGISGSWTQALLYLVFLMVPGVLAIFIDRFIILHQPDIVEDDLRLEKKGESLICRVKELASGFAKKLLEGLNEKLRLPMCAYFSYLPKGYHTTCLNPNSKVLLDRFMAQCLFYTLFLCLNIGFSCISLHLAENDPQLMEYVNRTEGLFSAAPSVMSLARERLEVWSMILVPGGWLLSTWLSYLFLLRLTDLELENMEFVYKRNEKFGGCFLSKKGESSQIEVREEEEEENETTSCSFFAYHPPDFDLSGQWIDTHEAITTVTAFAEPESDADMNEDIIEGEEDNRRYTV